MHVPQSAKNKGSWILVGATLQFLGFAALYKSVIEYDLRGGGSKPNFRKKLPRLFTASKTGYLDRKRLFR